MTLPGDKSQRQLVGQIRYEISQSLNAGANVSDHMRGKMLSWVTRLQEAERGLIAPQVVGRVWNDEGQQHAQLNSIGRALPDDAPLYALQSHERTMAGDNQVAAQQVPDSARVGTGAEAWGAAQGRATEGRTAYPAAAASSAAPSYGETPRVDAEHETSPEDGPVPPTCYGRMVDLARQLEREVGVEHRRAEALKEAMHSYEQAARFERDADRSTARTASAVEPCVYPEECAKLKRCIRVEDHDRPVPCHDNPYGTRRDGHSALRVKDGKLETFDPHPLPSSTRLMVNRYEPVATGMARAEHGEWVRYDDIADRLADRSATLPTTFPDVCDGQEQDAFERWASVAGMEMSVHPLHWLFLDAKTYAAREGWKAAIQYARKAAKVDSVPTDGTVADK